MSITPSDRLNHVLKLLQKPNSKNPQGFDSFAQRLLNHISLYDWQSFAPQELAALVESFWHHGVVRLAHTPKIRILTRSVQNTDTVRTIIQVVNDDMPFLLDSTLVLLRRFGWSPCFILHPVMIVARDAQGMIASISDTPSSSHPTYESFIHLEIEDVLSAEEQQQLIQELKYVLAEVRHAVTAWKLLREKSVELADLPELSPEERDFMRWLTQDNFTFLGYRGYQASSKGFVLEEVRGIDHVVSHVVGVASNPHILKDHFKALSISKAALISVVHKAELIDLVEVCIRNGDTTQVHQFLGLFTSASYDRPAKEIPVLRIKRQNIFERSGLQPQWHDGKLLTCFLNNFPRHTFFHLSEEEVLEFSAAILGLQERRYSRVLMHFDNTGQVVSCVLYIPKQDYSEALRTTLARILEDYLGGHVATSYLRVGEEAYAWIHFHVIVPSGTRQPSDLAELEQQLLEAIQPWDEKLRQALMATYGHARAGRLWKSFEGAFDSAYQRAFSLDQAVADVRTIEALSAKDEDAVAFAVDQGNKPETIHIRVFHANAPIPLSTILPIIENLGLRVLNEDSVTVGLHHQQMPVCIQVLEAITEDQDIIDIESAGPRLVACLEQVWDSRLDNDGFNKLIIKAGLRADEAQVLRAYARYMRQIPVPFSQDYIEETLVQHASISQKLFELFHRRLAPELPIVPKSFVAELKKAISAVSTSNEERILGLYLKLIMSTLRTNFYQPSVDGQAKPYLALKFDARKIEELPLPRPMFEVFVYSRFMEAVHLRGGPVARGGIRHSDRKEDFRTEILGLLKAQTPKNAVIVPVGAKGGFIVKGREAFEDVVRAYQTMIRGLLDVTDNLIDDKVVHPLRTRCYDVGDPYLVVAADKGTATFSDIANELAAAYGFWLGDAFASGGSYGYDHKKIGITARGAWESLKRHGYALGINLTTTPLTMVGVGDMSGDVFGNGLLQSDNLKLVGAFNHQHIFIDPNPDPKISFKERQRLFNLPKSTWADYDLTQASAGARLYSRNEKELVLSKEIKQMLGLASESISPNDLLRHLLFTSVDILWFGGIGTFIKASQETHADVGDRANDLVRVDGQQLRCRMVVEGANLGCTQKGRVEFALKGGLITTDFVDNVGGVNCSDHEVNIKILLNHLMQKRQLAAKERNKLLVEMTDSVAELVLRDSYQQALGLQISGFQAGRIWESHQNLIHYLEQAGRLNRHLEHLPDDATLQQRTAVKGANAGLVVPEIAVLTAYSKNTLRDALLAAEDLPLSLVETDFFGYFPKNMLTFKEAIAHHRLRKEITATVIANLVVNRMGCTFIVQLLEEFPEVSLAECVGVFLVVRYLWELDDTWQRLENAAVSFDVQMRLFEELRRWVTQACAVLLRHRHLLSLDDTTVLCRMLGVPVESMVEMLGLEKYQRRWERQQVPADLIQVLRLMVVRVETLDMALAAQRYQVSVEKLAPIYQDLIERLGVLWAQQHLQGMQVPTRWHKQHIRYIQDEMRACYEAVIGVMLANNYTIDAWIAEQGPQWHTFQQVLNKLRNLAGIDLSMLAVFVQHLGQLSQKRLDK